METHINANAELTPASLNSYEETAVVHRNGRKGAILENRRKIKGESVEDVKLEPLITTELNIKDETFYALTARDPAAVEQNIQVNKQPCVQELYKCTSCQFQTPCKAFIEKHVNEHVLGNFFSGDMQVKTLNIDAVRPNARVHSGEKSFTCEICDYKSVTQYALHLHIQNHIEQRSFKCRICQYTFSHMALLKRHMESYQKTFSNTLCE